MLREPIDLPPIVSVELIQITDKTSIPYAPKARKIIEETKKKEEERLVSEQAPPAAKAKEKPDRIPMPEDTKEIKKIVYDYGLEISLFQPFRDFEGMPEPYRSRAFDRAKKKFDVMNELGAKTILI